MPHRAGTDIVAQFLLLPLHHRATAPARLPPRQTSPLAIGIELPSLVALDIIAPQLLRNSLQP